MPLLFLATWPRILMLAMIGIFFAAPIAPFEVFNNVITGDYPPKF